MDTERTGTGVEKRARALPQNAVAAGEYQDGMTAMVISDYRYERKSLLLGLDEFELCQMVGFHPAGFFEHHPPRYVNNLYLDTLDRRCYEETIDGQAERVKFRIRWYGDLLGKIDRPVLELKSKSGLMGRKLSCTLSPFVLEDWFSADMLAQVFETSQLPPDIHETVQGLEAALINRYRRRYFQSFDRRFRITIDSDLRYYGVHPSLNLCLREVVDPSSTILEFKYARRHEAAAADVYARFPFRVTKSSKYKMGLEHLHLECL